MIETSPSGLDRHVTRGSLGGGMAPARIPVRWTTQSASYPKAAKSSLPTIRSGTELPTPST